MSGLDLINKYWEIIVGLVTVAITWAKILYNERELERRVIRLETSNETHSDNQTKIQVQLSQIQTDLLWVKERLGNIKY